MNLQCFYKLFSNRNFFKLISSQQQKSEQTVFVTRSEEERGDVSAESVCQDGVCGITSWKPSRLA